MNLLQKFPLQLRRNYSYLDGRDDLGTQDMFDHRNRLSSSEEAVGNATSFKSVTVFTDLLMELGFPFFEEMQQTLSFRYLGQQQHEYELHKARMGNS